MLVCDLTYWSFCFIFSQISHKMSEIGTDLEQKKYEKLISEIIQGELIDLYGGSGYKSIMQTMKNNSGKSEKEIISSYELFAKLAEGIFGRLAEPKILEPIKLEIMKIGEENVHQEEKKIEKRSMRLLIADDETEILELYKTSSAKLLGNQLCHFKDASSRVLENWDQSFLF